MDRPLVGVIMGSVSDWETMRYAAFTLDDFKVPYETQIVSAHRTPDRMFRYAGEAMNRGLQVIIAGAGGAADLPRMTASKTTLPVIGVPVQTHAFGGIDALLSIAQMPRGIPVATMTIGSSGAENAALLAIQILALYDNRLRNLLKKVRQEEQVNIPNSIKSDILWRP